MKSLLAILLCFILAEMPALAAGYTLGGTNQLTGTYAGTLIPNGDSNDLGLFTLSVPSTGVATGVVLIFSEGRTFFGTMQGVPSVSNPNGVSGIIDASFNFTLSVPTNTETNNGGVITVTTVISTEAVTATALGSFDATAVTSPDPETDPSPTGIDLNGTANLQVSQGEVDAAGAPIVTETIQLAIEGFQQSATPSDDTGTLTGETTTTTGG